MKKNRIQLALIVFVLVTISGCPYHKPPFMGKVIDAETKEPIEGAVAVVMYNKTAMGVGAGNISYTINVRESLTDKDGVFHLPSYTTVVFPFTWETYPTFIIYKPGFGMFPDYQEHRPGLNLPDQEIFFSNKLGAEKEFRVEIGNWQSEVRKLRTGIVELPRVKTRDERLKALRAADKTSDVRAEGISTKKLQKLMNLLNEESIDLGLTPYQEGN